MLVSLSQLIASLSSQLNTSIVRLEELDSAELGVSVAIDECRRVALDSLAKRSDEMRGVFAHLERFDEVLGLCDTNARIQSQLTRDSCCASETNCAGLRRACFPSSTRSPSERHTRDRRRRLQSTGQRSKIGSPGSGVGRSERGG